MYGLINKSVRHSLYGTGKVTDENEKRVVVDFSGVIRLFPMPDAISKRYLEWQMYFLSLRNRGRNISAI